MTLRDRSKRNEKRRESARNPCACGCGQRAINLFVTGHNTRLIGSAEQSRRGNLNTGAHFLDTGTKDTYRKVDQRHEHRTVAEQKLGRPLLPRRQSMPRITLGSANSVEVEP